MNWISKCGGEGETINEHGWEVPCYQWMHHLSENVHSRFFVFDFSG